MIDNDAYDDVVRSDLDSCHRCNWCIKHNNGCLIDPTFPVLECVEYVPTTKEATK